MTRQHAKGRGCLASLCQLQNTFKLVTGDACADAPEVETTQRLADLSRTGQHLPISFDLQDFFDLNIADKTRSQISKDLAALAATTGAPEDGVEDLLSLPGGAGTNPGSKISQVCPRAISVCCLL